MSKSKTTAKKTTAKDNNIVASPEPKKAAKKATTKQTLTDDIIGSNVPSETSKKVSTSAPKKTATSGQNRKVTVAIHSTKNVVWEGVGKVEKGYNIVKKAEADKWLTRSHIRLATPEEVAREYGA